MHQAPAFATALREWRQRRGLSQLELANRSGVSQRHLSFLELGRAAPSREMVSRLASSLDVPLRQHNAMLLAAGFAPEWRQRDLQAPELSQVTTALDYMLAQHEPYPAVVVDRQWNLLRANRGAGRLVEFLVGPMEPGAAVNLADALVAPDVLRPHLVNWQEVVRHFVHTVEADAAADGASETQALLERLLGYAGVREAIGAPAAGSTAGPVLFMQFRKAGVELRLFTTIATFGTPLDITIAEIRVESFFPMDAGTEEFFRSGTRS